MERDARLVGLYLSTYSPGDGITRYRFFDKPGNIYFGPDSGIYTALGRKDARTFLTGYGMGRNAAMGSILREDQCVVNHDHTTGDCKPYA